MKEVRNGVGDGLFTAFHGEHNWEVAHRTLLPASAPIVELDTDPRNRRFYSIDPRFDCAMRYGQAFQPFLLGKYAPLRRRHGWFLAESDRRTRRSRLESLLNRGPEHSYEQDVATMEAVTEEVIATRRANPSERKDLLNALLFGKDPRTGERLTDESVMNDMITLLIAGHETTSGLLSFTFHFLLKNPDALRKAKEEVDKSVGKGPVTVQHLSKLPYLEAVLRESLRL